MNRRYSLTFFLLSIVCAAAGPAMSQTWVRVVNVTSPGDSVVASFASLQTGFMHGVSPGRSTRPLPVPKGTYQLVVEAVQPNGSMVRIGGGPVEIEGDSMLYTVVVAGGPRTMTYTVASHRLRAVMKPDSVHVRVINLLGGTNKISYSLASFGGTGSFVRDNDLFLWKASRHWSLRTGDLRFMVIPEGGRRFVQSSFQLAGASFRTLIVTGTYDSTDLSRMLLYVLEDSDFSHEQFVFPRSFDEHGKGMLRYVSVLPDEMPVARIVASEVPKDTVEVAAGNATAMRTDIAGPVTRFDLIGAPGNVVAKALRPLVPGFVNTTVVHLDSTATDPVFSVIPSDIYNHPWQFGYTTVRIFAATGALHGGTIRIAPSGTSGSSAQVFFTSLPYTALTPYQLSTGGWATLTISVPTGGGDTLRRTYSGVLPLQGLVTLIVAGDPRIDGSCVVFTYDERSVSGFGPLPVWSITSGVASTPVAGPAVQVIPNPTAGALRITFGAMRSGGAHLAIVDDGGREVLRDRVQHAGAGEAWYELGPDRLPTGTYTAVVRDDHGAITGTARFVVRR